MSKTTPATPTTPAAPAVPTAPVPELTQETPAEPVAELPRKLNVIHKDSGQQFEVSKDYYLRNKAIFELCR